MFARIPLRFLSVVAALAAPAVAAAAGDAHCRVAVLRELGWRIEHGERARIAPGSPCERASVAGAHAAGDLVAVLPRDSSARETMLDTLEAHPATRCAFRLRYAESTRTALAALAANDGFRFSGLQARWISFAGGARSQGWIPTASFGRAYVPADSNARAIDAFVHGRVRGECGFGRQAAQLATFAVLFGDDGLDAMFAREELAIGTFRRLERSASILRGSSTGRMFADGLARETSKLGRAAFVGAPGFVVHAGAFSTLRDPTNQALNFVVHDVDPAAVAALRTHGGFAHYNALNERLWRLSREVDPRDRRGFERLLGRGDDALLARVSPGQRDAVREMRAILDDPFYGGFRIYVHDHGIRPVGWHLARLLDRNPGTPYRVELALHNLDGEIRARWQRWRLARCRSSGDEGARNSAPRPRS